MPVPLGLHSAQLDDVRALRTKAGRREQQRFTVEGATMLEEALRAGARPDAVYVTDRGHDALGPLAAAVRDRLFLVPERAAGRLSDLETPPGVLGVFPWALEPLEAILATRRPGLVLAGVGDPGNAGTLLRSADIFGVGSAVFVQGTVEPYNPKVVRATMGAIFRLRLALAEPEALVAAAGDHGYSLVAAARNGTPLPEFRFPERCLIAIGNERHGVSESLPRRDLGVAIPQPGQGESLNAAIAGSIILYAFSQQSSATMRQS